MNVFERAKIQMRIGTKKQEYEGRILGTKYSPSNPILCLASIFFLVLGSGAGYAIFCTNLSLVIKVIAGILGIYWMLTSWRGFARIIFRISNSRDW